ncbi:MAG TPA: BON domain-containing protein [Thermoanaerobaculia bacterium]|jgi:osmotically-inducible protein OsmY
MRLRALSIPAAVWLGVVMIPLAGCNNPDSAVHAERDAQGNTQVHVNGQKVDQNVNQANKDFKAAGDQLKAGADQAGAALQRGADKVQTQMETKVVPAAKEMLSDASITAKVKTQLAGDPAINALYVNVDTSNGQVTLTGKVALAEQKAEAEKVARGVDGVKTVVNQLQVTGQTPGK